MRAGYGEGSAVDMAPTAEKAREREEREREEEQEMSPRAAAAAEARRERMEEEHRKSLAKVREVASDGHGGEYWDRAAGLVHASDKRRDQEDKEDEEWEFLLLQDLEESVLSRKLDQHQGVEQGPGLVTGFEVEKINSRTEGRWRRQWGRPESAWLPERAWRSVLDGD